MSEKESDLRSKLHRERYEVLTQCMAIMDREEYGNEAFNVAAFAAWFALSGDQRDSFRQLLFHGPVWDGDNVSKSGRDDLIRFKLATRCCHKGEQGYTASTYRAYTIWRAAGQDTQKRLDKIKDDRNVAPSPPDAPAIPEGFTAWEGGECPVPVGTTVDVLFNDGTLIKDSSAEIWSRVPHGHDYWGNKPIDVRIIAYRPTAYMARHDRSPESPVSERVWIHYMDATGVCGGNGWSDEIDWAQADLYEIRPEGPPDFGLAAARPSDPAQQEGGEEPTSEFEAADKTARDIKLERYFDGRNARIMGLTQQAAWGFDEGAERDEWLRGWVDQDAVMNRPRVEHDQQDAPAPQPPQQTQSADDGFPIPVEWVAFNDVNYTPVSRAGYTLEKSFIDQRGQWCFRYVPAESANSAGINPILDTITGEFKSGEQRAAEMVDQANAAMEEETERDVIDLSGEDA